MEKFKLKDIDLLEYVKKHYIKAYTIIFPAFLAGAITLSNRKDMLDSHMFPFQIATAAFYITGKVLDMKSTVKAVQISQRLGIGYKELGVCIKKYPQNDRDIFNPSKIAFDASLLLPSMIYPPLGVGFGLASFFSAGFNELSDQILEFATNSRENK